MVREGPEASMDQRSTLLRDSNIQKVLAVPTLNTQNVTNYELVDQMADAYLRSTTYVFSRLRYLELIDMPHLKSLGVPSLWTIGSGAMHSPYIDR
jgi:hypothetical protein